MGGNASPAWQFLQTGDKEDTKSINQRFISGRTLPTLTGVAVATGKSVGAPEEKKGKLPLAQEEEEASTDPAELWRSAARRGGKRSRGGRGVQG